MPTRARKRVSPAAQTSAHGRRSRATWGSGDDTIRGHKGFDDISGGSDVIKADDGRRDVVRCGRGDDKADVDLKDDVSGCEKKT